MTNVYDRRHFTAEAIPSNVNYDVKHSVGLAGAYVMGDSRGNCGRESYGRIDNKHVAVRFRQSITKDGMPSGDYAAAFNPFTDPDTSEIINLKTSINTNDKPARQWNEYGLSKFPARNRMHCDPSGFYLLEAQADPRRDDREFCVNEYYYNLSNHVDCSEEQNKRTLTGWNGRKNDQANLDENYWEYYLPYRHNIVKYSWDGQFLWKHSIEPQKPFISWANYRYDEFHNYGFWNGRFYVPHDFDTVEMIDSNTRRQYADDGFPVTHYATHTAINPDTGKRRLNDYLSYPVAQPIKHALAILASDGGRFLSYNGTKFISSDKTGVAPYESSIPTDFNRRSHVVPMYESDYAHQANDQNTHNQKAYWCMEYYKPNDSYHKLSITKANISTASYSSHNLNLTGYGFYESGINYVIQKHYPICADDDGVFVVVPKKYAGRQKWSLLWLNHELDHAVAEFDLSEGLIDFIDISNYLLQSKVCIYGGLLYLAAGGYVFEFDYKALRQIPIRYLYIGDKREIMNFVISDLSEEDTSA
ncbi:hypothetical protein KS4_18050 [Poriferisphaera corsica]|uniref:Uncharacterized protein n=1 Tax=Poriferisphaera corsica TaxID=2528020 RepID=A0A517YU43_9BACT|nr:hypothetical protein [Poriferisphaera corsica]QDU33748.1 hypothetical protein KS4_18050 [Poriferisphaera corsica]